ncbi:hypothetical protein RAA17_16830 [Komagataeibacter rhaeticus]|nr:hypothetical protein [Komagataeibacter rhaeticus]
MAFFHEGPLWAGNHVHVLRPRAGVDGRFVAHALNTVAYDAYVEGATRPKLTRARMNSLPVPCPRLPASAALRGNWMARWHVSRASCMNCRCRRHWRANRPMPHCGMPCSLMGAIRSGCWAVCLISWAGHAPTARADCWGGDVPWLTPPTCRPGHPSGCAMARAA